MMKKWGKTWVIFPVGGEWSRHFNVNEREKEQESLQLNTIWYRHLKVSRLTTSSVCVCVCWLLFYHLVGEEKEKERKKGREWTVSKWHLFWNKLAFFIAVFALLIGPIHGVFSLTIFLFRNVILLRFSYLADFFFRAFDRNKRVWQSWKFYGFKWASQEVHKLYESKRDFQSLCVPTIRI